MIATAKQTELSMLRVCIILQQLVAADIKRLGLTEVFFFFTNTTQTLPWILMISIHGNFNSPLYQKIWRLIHLPIIPSIQKP